MVEFWSISNDLISSLFMILDSPDPAGTGGSSNNGNRARDFFRPGPIRDKTRDLWKVSTAQRRNNGDFYTQILREIKIGKLQFKNLPFIGIERF